MKLYSTIVSAMVLGATAINSITGGVNTAFDAGNNLYNIVETSEKSVDEMGKASSYGINIEPTNYDTSKLSNTKQSWYFVANNNHTQPQGNSSVALNKYNAYYVGNTNEKKIYLTFDEGYENGYTSKILDVLKAKNVKAAFFVTKPYIESDPELVKRMVAEGHLVGNHSVKHLSSPTLSDSQLKNELTETAQAFEKVTGQAMPKVFRPPMGEYSERTLAVTSNMGYKTVFWSFAYKDWITTAQPGKDVAYNTVMSKYHNGAVLLLHAVSKSNTEALGDIIDSLRAKGYTFDTLNNL